MKIVVAGAAGMLGSKVVEVLRPDHDVVGLAREAGDDLGALDVTRLSSARAVLGGLAPDVVVNCAAFTAVDACETERDRAMAVNALGARNLAIASRECEAALFHVSTDYVFDGTKDGPYDEYDVPAPRSVYGASKLAGEEMVRQFADRWWIGRVQWLYGEGGANFADTILRLSTEKDSLKVVDDQHGSPTYTGDAARTIKALISAAEYGLYHMSNEGQTTWWGFTRALLEHEGRGDYSVDPVTTDEFPRPAPRPRNSVLRNLNLELTRGETMRPWQDGMAEYMERREDSRR